MAEELTERQLEVVRLVTAGLTDKDIAGRLGVALSTVRYHIKAIRRRIKLDMRGVTRTVIAVEAIKRGWVTL